MVDLQPTFFYFDVIILNLISFFGQGQNCNKINNIDNNDKQSRTKRGVL